MGTNRKILSQVVHLLYPVAWVGCGAILLSYDHMASNRWIPLLALTVMGIMSVVFVAPKMDFEGPSLYRLIGSLFVMVAVPILCWSEIRVVDEGWVYYSQKQWMVDRERLDTDPLLFPLVQNMAKDNFDLELALGDGSWSWAMTAAGFEGSGPAFAEPRSGYCELHVNTKRLADGRGPEPRLRIPWLQSVMVHELGHCLDVMREYPNRGRPEMGFRSIAPTMASKVTDLKSYLAATKELETQLWREAFGDIFSIGYLRLSAPDDARELIAWIRKFRLDHADGDRAHATMCWIDFAVGAPPPSSVKDLLAWSDDQRTRAGCAAPPASSRS